MRKLVARSAAVKAASVGFAATVLLAPLLGSGPASAEPAVPPQLSVSELPAELVTAIAHEHLHQVVLGHLSEDCNCPATAAGFIRSALAGMNLHNVDVWCADRKAPSHTRDVARMAIPPVPEPSSNSPAQMVLF